MAIYDIIDCLYALEEVQNSAITFKRIKKLSPTTKTIVKKIIKKEMPNVSSGVFTGIDKEDDFILVAYNGKIPIGILTGCINYPYHKKDSTYNLILEVLPNEKSISYVNVFAISKEYQGSGLGSRMFNALIKACKNNVICLCTSNMYAYKFYEKRGFHRLWRTKDNYTMYYVWSKDSQKLAKLKKIRKVKD